ncbi:MAG: hypothetical protein FJY54_10940 [Betaproteobacteria bacterium]|nr:hypothetical protein [Betaproteobacteria bacterium]
MKGIHILLALIFAMPFVTRAQVPAPPVQLPPECRERDADPEKCVIKDGPPPKQFIRKKPEPPAPPPPPKPPPVQQAPLTKEGLPR